VLITVNGAFTEHGVKRQWTRTVSGANADRWMMSPVCIGAFTEHDMGRKMERAAGV